MEQQAEERLSLGSVEGNSSFRMPNVGRLSNASQLSCSQAFCSLRFDSQESPAWICSGDTQDCEIPAFCDKAQKQEPPWRALLWH